jgi:two-component system response regulator VicR
VPKLKSILIAEDEPDTANLLQFHLQRHGYHTTVAADGAGALNLSFERRPDLVILDLMLPKVHGFEVCRMLNDYMTKPFAMPELLARVESLLRDARVRDPSIQ